MLTSSWGHTPVVQPAKGGDCFRYMKYGNGPKGVKRYLEKDARSLATDLINLPFVEERNGNWGIEMDKTRDRLRFMPGNTKRKMRTYGHFIISPDPEDGIDLDTLRELAVAWAAEMFGFENPSIGEAQVAIEYHDDNAQHIPHAHIIVNDVDLRDGRALQINAAQGREMASRLQELAWERGLRGFDQRGVSRLAAEEPDARKPDRFANAPQRRKTMTERAMERDGRPSWKQEIKDAIEVACNMASTPEEVVDRLAQMGIVAMPRQAKRVRPGEDYIFYYPQPGVPLEENKKRVSGERLGARYTAAGMRAQIRVSYYRKLYAEDKDAAALLDMLVDVRDVELQRGQTLADLSKAFAAISNFHITNMQDAKRSQEIIERQIKEGIEAGRNVQTQLDQAAQLEALLRIGPAANIVPAMREQSRTYQSSAAAKQERRERTGEKVPLEEKIARGYRLTKEEHAHLRSRDRTAFRVWQENRRAVERGRKPTARLGGGGSSKAPGSSSYNHAGPAQGPSRGARSR